MTAMHSNLSSHLIEMKRAEILRLAAEARPRPERRSRRRLSLRWRRGADGRAPRVAPA
jgi:hypothetical protein